MCSDLRWHAGKRKGATSLAEQIMETRHSQAARAKLHCKTPVYSIGIVLQFQLVYQLGEIGGHVLLRRAVQLNWVPVK